MNRDQLDLWSRKGAHFGLRFLGWAPDQLAARRLPTAGAAQHGRRVLIVTPRSWAVHVQLEAVIGHALQLRGADVSFLTCGGELEICDRCNTYEGPPMPCHSCRKYVHDTLGAHGLPWTPMQARWDADHLDRWDDLDGLSLDELFAVTWNGLPLGHLVDIPVRWFLLRSALEEDPLATITARRFLRTARRVAAAAEAALDDLKPDTIVLLNGLFFFESIVRAVAIRRGTDVICYERGFVIDSWIFHRRDPMFMYHHDEAWGEWQDVALTPDEEARLDHYLDDRRHGRKTILSSWKGIEARPVQRHAGGRRVLLFTNLTWDSAVLRKEVAFASIHDWLGASVEFFRARPADELIIRIHPSEVKMPGKLTREPLGAFLHERFPQLPANVRVIEADDPTSSYSLMETADVGLVYTSTTGMELTMLGIPTVVAGEVHYRGLGFTHDAESPAAFSDVLTRLLARPEDFTPDVDRARRYGYFFFFRAPVVVPGIVEHRPGLVRLDVRRPAELRQGADADLDRLCDAILSGRSFVASPVDR